MEKVLLKLSGQALSNGTGILSPEKLAEVANEIKELKSTGVGIGIVVGAGNIWRGRDSVGNHMDRLTADDIGMLGTVINAIAVESALKDVGLKAVTLNSVPMPTVTKLYTHQDAKNYLENGFIVLFAGGTGHPFFSTDTCAALRAAEIGAKKILMAKNGTDGVYDKAPNKYPDAKRYTSLTYAEMLNKKLEVMDLTAATICQDNDIETIVFNMNQAGNIKKIITNPEIGTVVKVK